MFIIKQLRREKNINQTDLAQAVGVSLRTIQLYEKKGANIPIKNLTKIAEYFETTLAELYTYEVNEDQEQYLPGKDRKKQLRRTLQNGKKIIDVPLVSKELYEDYANTLDETKFTDTLPHMGFVMEHFEERMFRGFEITGNAMDNSSRDSMPDGTIVLTYKISENELKTTLENKSIKYFIIVYKNAVLCKEILCFDKGKNGITCHSINPSPEYSDFTISLSDVKQFCAIIIKQIKQ